MSTRIVRGAYVAVALAGALGLSPLVSAATADVPRAGNESEQQTQPKADAKGNGSLRAAAVRIDITPPVDPNFRPLDEYEHEKLNIRAIVFENGGKRVALIGADLSGIDESVWAEASPRVAKALNTPVENVIISSTHTHSAVLPGPPPPSGAPRYGADFVGDVMVDAVKQARAKLEPALVGYSTGTADLNVGRDAIDPVTKLWTQAADLDAPVDKSVAVLSFVRPDGAPIAAYLTYAMHPVNGYLSGVVSGDFASATSRYVETAFGDDMVTVFAQGASGDVNPRWLRAGTNMLASRSGAEITGYELVREDVEAPMRSSEVPLVEADPDVLREMFDYMQALGIILGEEVIRVMSHTDAPAADPQIWSSRQNVTCPGRTRLDNIREGVPGQYEDGPDVAIRTGVLGIGDVALSTVNAEIYSKIGLRVKEESPLSKTMLVTLANGKAASGYIPDDESFLRQSFQALGSKLKSGCAEDGIVDSISGQIAAHTTQK